jgi:predicted O-methyltransferase YrrM
MSIIETLQKKLDSGIITGRLLLSQMRLLNEASRQTPAYSDPKYVPFYYHLGGLIYPKNVLEIGLDLGLLGGCFLKACKTAEKYVAFQQKTTEYYSPRLAISNIKSNFKGDIDYYVGEITDFVPKIATNYWDLIIINEELNFDRHLLCLDLLWQHLSVGGIIIMESLRRHNPAKEAFLAFSASQNREATVFQTRYGTGFIQK